MLRKILFAAVASIAIASVGFAQTKEAKEEKAGCGGCSTGKACCQEAALVKMPSMGYKVGDKTVACPDEAAKLAKESKTTVKYVVGDKSFDDKGEALVAYTKELNGFVESATSTVKFSVNGECMACPVSAGDAAKKSGKPMMYRVATVDFKNESDAKKALAAAKEAADKVEMKIMVGDKSMSCPVSAADVAKKENKKVEYVVGESRTCCDVEGKLNLARAKAEAICSVLAKAAKA